MKKFTNFATILMVSTMLQSQTTIFVKPDGTGDGTSWENACNLENAIVSAPPNDQVQIWVQKGTYYPTKMLTITPSVKIYGGFAGTENSLSQRNFSANPTIIDGQKKIGSIFRLENAAEINGFTVQNGNASGNQHKNGGGVWADENCVIANCIIINNTAVLDGGGVYAKGKVEIINSTVKNNVAQGSGNDLFGNCLNMTVDRTALLPSMNVGCNSEPFDLGEVRFKSDRIWMISANGITQQWTDVVIAEGCNKTTYNGGTPGNYYADCRVSADRSLYGDWFSWCAAVRFSDVLCPEGWRVPTFGDFRNLDIALGGYGNGLGPGTVEANSLYGPRYNNAAIREKYTNTWGGAFNGFLTGSTPEYQGILAYYISQSEYSSENYFMLEYASPYFNNVIMPQCPIGKNFSAQVRCVR